MFVNIAYFAAVSKEEMLESGTVVAAVFFGNMFGKQAEKVMSVFVALSAFGNVLSVLFSQGRGMYALNPMYFYMLIGIYSCSRARSRGRLALLQILCQ
jgi:amino acid transporter